MISKILSICLLIVTSGIGKATAISAPSCERPGWFPQEFGLKDHAIFFHNNRTYLIATRVPYTPEGPLRDPLLQDRFAVGSTDDLCAWEELPAILAPPHPQPQDVAVWAPFVYPEGGVYHLFYTGVTQAMTQTIQLATTADPANSGSWQFQGVLLQPPSGSKDMRDPMVTKIDDEYFMVYASRNSQGSYIGAATAASLAGPWQDLGSITPPSNDDLESPTLVAYGQAYYLFYTVAYQGGVYRIGNNPTGPWQEVRSFQPGWAHEIWQDTASAWKVSFLTDYTATISPLTWDAFFPHPLPLIAKAAHHTLLPIIYQH